MKKKGARWKKLTRPQVAALGALLKASSWGKLADKGRETSAEQPWCVRVHSRAATALVKLGYARERCVTVDGREVRGADLARLLGHWSTKFEITKLGKRAWAHVLMSGRPS